MGNLSECVDVSIEARSEQRLSTELEHPFAHSLSILSVRASPSAQQSEDAPPCISSYLSRPLILTAGPLIYVGTIFDKHQL